MLVRSASCFICLSNAPCCFDNHTGEKTELVDPPLDLIRFVNILEHSYDDPLQEHVSLHRLELSSTSSLMLTHWFAVLGRVCAAGSCAFPLFRMQASPHDTSVADTVTCSKGKFREGGRTIVVRLLWEWIVFVQVH